MPRYRTKPCTIEAEPYVAGGHIPDGVCHCGPGGKLFGDPHIHTLEGMLHVSDGDMIITGLLGEKYPCKPAAFHGKYELDDGE